MRLVMSCFLHQFDFLTYIIHGYYVKPFVFLFRLRRYANIRK